MPAKKKVIIKLPKLKPKKKEIQLSTTCEYDVEEVLGFKYDNNKLLFFIKWSGWKHEDNTWATYEDLVNCVVFRDYINRYYISLQDDILAEAFRIRYKLKEEITKVYNRPRVSIMYDILPFDPLELKVMQVFNHLITETDEDFKKKLEDLTFRGVFFSMDLLQQQKIDDLLTEIYRQGVDNVTIENIEDFSYPDKFVFVTKNIVQEKAPVDEVEETPEGCKCTNCSKFTACCSQKLKMIFPYKNDNNGRTLLRLEKSKKIIECCELCSCGDNCDNKLTQLQMQAPLCLFKTDERGWGLKADDNIPKGGFIMEFVGEVISLVEADSRGRTAYMFDINSGSDEYSTIDATFFGNLSRFINHSCEPNAGTWVVNDCRDEPRNQRLCFFAEKFIRKGEEITINYDGDGNAPTEKTTQCKCGAAKCNGFIL